MKEYIFGLFKIKECTIDHFTPFHKPYSLRKHYHVLGATTDAICMKEKDAKSHALAFTMLTAMQMGEPMVWESLMNFVLKEYPFNMSQEDAIKYFNEQQEKKKIQLEIVRDVPDSVLRLLRKDD